MGNLAPPMIEADVEPQREGAETVPGVQTDHNAYSVSGGVPSIQERL
jgi:hypothetical protein